MFSRAQTPADTAPRDAGVSDRRRTLLQEGTCITGEFTSDGIVDLAGQIIGDLTADTLVLARSGTAEGTIRARNVTIEGLLRGKIIAHAVAIKSIAKVEADITCQTISLDPGAEITGHLSCVPSPVAP